MRIGELPVNFEALTGTTVNASSNGSNTTNISTDALLLLQDTGLLYRGVMYR